MNDPAIATNGLSKDYGEGCGLFDLELTVKRGEILGFIGPNGSGKSTTMRLLLDLIAPSAGEASVLGLDSHRDSLAIRSRIGYLPGDFALYGQLNGEAMLDHLAGLRGGVNRQLRDSLVELFDAELERSLHQLSTGNRQKIGLIQALMHEPELLIFDEPIAGLDPLVQQNFHKLLKEIRAEGRTVFLSSHTLSEVEQVADRIAVLREGRLVVVDDLERLHSVAVQRIDFEFVSEVPATEFRSLPGVLDAEENGRHLVISFEGSVDSVLKVAAKHEVRAIRSHEDDLEEIFLRYYRGEGYS